MVRRFVNELGGRMVIESAVGRGTVVTLLMPCSEVTANDLRSERPTHTFSDAGAPAAPEH
jgi:hypothetical protein